MNNALLEFVKRQFEHEHSGHDWFHIQRVIQNALYLQEMEGGDREIIHLVALLHDISDHKLNGGILNDGHHKATELLTQFSYSTLIIERVAGIIDEISFKGKGVPDQNSCLESKIVQDADRLDAIGAIGIARAFAYGGANNRILYDPNIPPKNHQTFEEYAQDKSHTINHFYEKLLTLESRMHTNTAKKLARRRTIILEDFLKAFYAEWNLTS